MISWLDFVLGQLALPPGRPAGRGRRLGGATAGVDAPSPSPGDGLPSLRVPAAFSRGRRGGHLGLRHLGAGVVHETQPPRPPLHGLYELTYFWLILGAQAVPAAAVALAVGLRPGPFRLLATSSPPRAPSSRASPERSSWFRRMAASRRWTRWKPPAPGGRPDRWAAQGWWTSPPRSPPWSCSLPARSLSPAPAVRQGYQADLAGTDGAVRQRQSPGAHRDRGRCGPRRRARRHRDAVPPAVPLRKRGQSSHGQAGYQSDLPANSAGPPPSPQVAALEVENWSDLGGTALLSRLQADAGKINAALNADFARQHAYTVRDFRNVEPWCADIVTSLPAKRRLLPGPRQPDTAMVVRLHKPVGCRGPGMRVRDLAAPARRHAAAGQSFPARSRPRLTAVSGRSGPRAPTARTSRRESRQSRTQEGAPATRVPARWASSRFRQA